MSYDLPQYHGQTLHDGSVVESPRFAIGHHASREVLLRLPVEPHAAHVPYHQDRESIMSPVSPIPSPSNHGGSGGGTRIRARTVGGGDPNRWLVPLATERERERAEREEEEYYRAQHRRGPGSTTSRAAYVEDYSSDEERREREQQPAYRRPNRRHTRPPPAHGYLPEENRLPGPTGRYSSERGRGSVDVGRSSYEYGSDSRSRSGSRKPRFRLSQFEDEEGRPITAYSSREKRERRRGSRPPDGKEVMRLPWTMWMNSGAKNHFVAFVGEFVGTTMFLFFAFSGTQVANIQSTSQNYTTTGADTGFSPQTLQYISLVFGFSLMVNVWIFFRISGGLFNPAVTFAMLITKAMSPIRCFLLLVAQLAGSIFSSYLVSVMFPTPLNVRTTLSAETSLARGVFIEAVLTAELVFTIFMLAKEKHKATFIAPVGIGLALFVAELVGVYYTGGSLNPARSFGPCVVTGIFDHEHWIYWVGPGAGAIIAVIFYNFIKTLEYEMANPLQDADEKDVQEKES